MPVPKWVVRKATPREDYAIELLFADGQRGIYDLKPKLGEPLYAPLRQMTLFLAARVECGTVVWGNDIDIAPEILYGDSTAA